jgi:hypothetical protein
MNTANSDRDRKGMLTARAFAAGAEDRIGPSLIRREGIYYKVTVTGQVGDACYSHKPKAYAYAKSFK